MAAISHLVREFAVSRIGDTSTGFNYWIAQVWNPTYGLPVSTVPSINTSSPGTNFFVGQVRPELLEASGYNEYPACMVYNVSASDTHIVSPAQFGGVVQVGVDFWMPFETEEVPSDVETPCEAVQDAMYQSFNSQTYYGLWVGQPYTYNNEMSTAFGPVTPGGPNWLRLVRFALTFRVFNGT